jgi:hypothetical protein
MDFITNIYANNGELINSITGVIVAANAVTACTKTTVDNKILNIVLKILNFMSMNFGHNKNADDK